MSALLDHPLELFVGFSLTSLILAAMIVSLIPAVWQTRRLSVQLWQGWRNDPAQGLGQPLPSRDWSHLPSRVARVAGATRHLLADLGGYVEGRKVWAKDDGGNTFATLDHALAGEVGDYGAVNYVLREVWGWLQEIERLCPSDRELLKSRGVDPDELRRIVLDDGDFATRANRLVATLRHFDHALGRRSADPYRTASATPEIAQADGAIARPTVRLGQSETQTPDEHSHPWGGGERERGYAQLMARDAEAFVRLARSYCRDEAEAQDLVQEIHLAIWHALPRWEGRSSLRTYAFRIARYRAIAHLRRRRIDAEEMELTDDAGGAEQWLLEQEQRGLLEQAIESLPVSLRRVLRLRLEERSYDEIANTVGITEKNVSVRLSRARAELRKRLCDA